MLCNAHNKTPVLESLFKKQATQLATSLKITPAQVFSCEYCEFFTNAYFEKHLGMAAFEI